MMEEYQKPEVEIINLEMTDVISASGETVCGSDCPHERPPCVLTPVIP